MTQDGVLINGGLTIRRPTRRPSAAKTDFVCATQDSVDSANEDTDEEASQSHRDEETHIALQEMAFHHAMEQARSVVRTILLKANQHRYHQVHEFFQRYMHSVCRKGKNMMADDPSELKVTAFPSLTKLPAVAIVSGSDATFSDVWMTPVCQVINRSFPLVVVIPGDTTDVRQLVEFLTERMDDYSVVREREEKWLLEQIEQWGELDKLDGPDQQENKSAGTSRETRLSREKTRLKTRAVELRVDSKSDINQDRVDAQVSGKRKRPHGVNPANSKTRSGRYKDTQMEDLLDKLQDAMDGVRRQNDPSFEWISAIKDSLIGTLERWLTECNGDLDLSIKCYERCVEWTKTRIAVYQSSRSTATEHSRSLRVATAEFFLAQLMQEILKRFVSFLHSKSEIDPEALAKERDIRSILRRHGDVYHLHDFDFSRQHEGNTRLDPFPILCIEHLDSFDLRVLQDFVELWSYHTSLQDLGDVVPRFGFIFGVTTTTSQTLRVLGRSVVRRLDLQFYPLDDSKSQSEAIFEALVANHDLPLCLRGETLHLLDDRHLASQSLTVLMQVLDYVVQKHFRDVKWSFLSHFALDNHCRKPLHAVASPSEDLVRWMQQTHHDTTSIASCLDHFSGVGLEDLKQTVSQKNGSQESDSWLVHLESELSQFRSYRRRWTVGWKCFRAAVAWYRLEKRAETFVESMAVALDGKIREAKLVEWIVTMLEVHPWELILHVLEEWSVFIAPLKDHGLAQEVQDLIELCQHVLETYREEETAEMRPVLRKEVSQFFRTRIVSLMESVDIDPNSIGGMISQWTTPSATVVAWRRLQLTQFESMEGLLQNPKQRREPSWAGDVSRAFQYYDDHIGLYMNLTSWFEAFVEATQKDVDVSSDVMVTLTARFTRAIATLREWGYIAGPDGVLRRFMRNGSRDLVVEKLLFL